MKREDSVYSLSLRSGSLAPKMAAAAAAAARQVRAFKRWMKSQGIEHSDALRLIDHHPTEEGISVITLCDLHEGDLVATIPKVSCLTIKSSGARDLIESAGLDGYLGLSVALMYEKSLGQSSSWFGYLQLLPEFEPIPLLWTLEEVESLLLGTELHKIIKEDMALVYDDWKECIMPLLASDSFGLNPDFFGVEQYLAAKSLIASRSFEIDDYHGFGMVPLADLFNHKTGAEDVHFTSVPSTLMFENDEEDSPTNDVNEYVGSAEDNLISEEAENTGYGEQSTQNALSADGSCSDTADGSCSDTTAFGDDPAVLEMIIVKDVKSGTEVFNTYGYVGNAALLHRYGFTEADNPFDIVNIDLELVLQWSSSLFSGRHSRMRLSLWRRLDYGGCVSQNSEYFEISSNGEPQVELLILLYIILLPEEPYRQLDLTVSTAGSLNESLSLILPGHSSIEIEEVPEASKDLLMTKGVRKALLAIANIRESFYGSNSFEDDIDLLRRSCRLRERKLYHSLMLRTSERRILQKLRAYAAAAGAQLSRAVVRKKLKRI